MAADGDENGDGRAGIITIRHLYCCTNEGGYWGPAEKIGTNVHKTRLLP